MKNTLSNDGDLQQVQSRRANDTFRNYANGFAYTAAGAVASMRLGNGKFESTQFNSRLQPTQIALGGSAGNTNLLKLDYTYNTPNAADNNGNVLSQTITVPTVGANAGFTAVQSYTYDSLNRLRSATENVTPNGGTAAAGPFVNGSIGIGKGFSGSIHGTAGQNRDGTTILGGGFNAGGGAGASGSVTGTGTGVLPLGNIFGNPVGQNGC
ncbi:MAG: hypothetical protein ACKVQW_10035 [Pyrinomonadaceae bacterium]